MPENAVTYHEVFATLLTPCCISEQPAMGNEVETLDYIPGTALRGMLAEAYLRNGGAPDAMFRQIFCSDKARFPNLYPQNCYPLPLSADTCKRNPGFTRDEEDRMTGELRHGVWDLLFENADDFTQTCRDRRHVDDDCAGPLMPHKKRWYNGDEVALRSRESPLSLLTMRTAVRLPSGSALDGSLHSQQELPPGTTFTGKLIASNEPVPGRPKKLVEALLEKLDGATSAGIVAYTGRRRAGQVRISIRDSSTAEAQPHFFEQWPIQSDHLYLSLTFTSDVILIDRLLRPIITLDRDGKVLKGEMYFPRSVGVEVEKAFVSTRRVSGWNAVAQLFKPDDVAMVMGSAFLLKVRKDDRALVEDWMGRCLAEGVGLRRAEGFGRVLFDEPFHLAAAREKGGLL